MKKNKVLSLKRLTLSRETLCQLEEPQIEEVAGGLSTIPCSGLTCFSCGHPNTYCC